jgi:hypothetical protein
LEGLPHSAKVATGREDAAEAGEARLSRARVGWLRRHFPLLISLQSAMKQRAVSEVASVLASGN